MKGVSRRDFDMVLAWSVDRLGRSLTGLLELLTELHAKHVDLYLHQQGLDTSTPSGKAMFQMMGVFAEFERSMFGNECWLACPGRRLAAPAAASRSAVRD
jgi:DNA invertase Pin-like site-specific DNA recombinase